MDQIISISEFEKYFKKNGSFRFSGLTVKQQSVWLGVFDDCINKSDCLDEYDELSKFLSPAEVEAIAAHPTKDPMSPLLTFPCTKKELRTFILWAIDKGFIYRDECDEDIKKLISCQETAEEIVAKGRQAELSKKEIAKRVDDCFYGEDEVTDKALGILLVGGRALSDSGYVSCARRARGRKK